MASEPHVALLSISFYLIIYYREPLQGGGHWLPVALKKNMEISLFYFILFFQ